ncbi:hypothetical protein RHCRD62_20627 [Rhodococcus sp. RD6.2]|nr:hypothetical protein RHCRD62_20627 [Rhodococcus sp. RD6.2]
MQPECPPDPSVRPRPSWNREGHKVASSAQLKALWPWYRTSAQANDVQREREKLTPFKPVGQWHRHFRRYRMTRQHK